MNLFDLDFMTNHELSNASPMWALGNKNRGCSISWPEV